MPRSITQLTPPLSVHTGPAPSSMPGNVALLCSLTANRPYKINGLFHTLNTYYACLSVLQSASHLGFDSMLRLQTYFPRCTSRACFVWLKKLGSRRGHPLDKSETLSHGVVERTPRSAPQYFHSHSEKCFIMGSAQTLFNILRCSCICSGYSKECFIRHQTLRN